MRGRDDQRAARLEVVDERHRRARRLRPGRCRRRARRAAPAPAARSAAIHRRDVGDVPRERAQVGGDRLLVADVGEDRPEDGQRRARFGRDVQAACAISASSADVFSATVLPPVFGPVMTSTRVGGISVMSTATGSRSRATRVPPSSRVRETTAGISSGWRAPGSSSRPSVDSAGRDWRGTPRRAAPWPGSRPASVAASIGARAVRRRAARKALVSAEQDPVDLFGLLAPRARRCSLLISTVASGSRYRLAPLAELPWIRPGMAWRCSASRPPRSGRCGR